MKIAYKSKTGETTIKLTDLETRQFLSSTVAVQQVRKGMMGARDLVVPYSKPTRPIQNIELERR